MANNSKPEKFKKFITPKKPRTDETLIMAFLAILAFVLIFIFITGHTHGQLDKISSDSKLFVTNKLEKFAKVCVCVATYQLLTVNNRILMH